MFFFLFYFCNKMGLFSLILKRLKISNLLLLHTGCTLWVGQLLPVPPLLNNFLVCCGLQLWVLANGSMALLVHLLNLAGCNSILDEPRELLLVSLLVILLQVSHVVRHMLAKDVLTVDGSRELAGLRVVSRESTGAVGDVNASIGCSLESTKDPGSCGGAGKSHIKVSPEGSWGAIYVLHIELLTGNINLTLVGLVQTKLLQQSSGEKKSCAVSSRIVG